MRRDHGEGRAPDAAGGRVGPRVHADLTRAARLAVYGTAGLAVELGWTGARRRPRTSLWMLPVYAGAALAFEPVHDALQRRPLPVRACVYAAGFTAVEYLSGRALRALTGEAPWDYAHARWHAGGLVRADYLPLWAAAGLLYERLHDRLVR